mmetsp:Transcript_58590/g.156004  ORF Transcript_58590/g.156004 Transcript_58590/m.156004 type:complete len:211 (+) Transcript_58590:125-757(+)
MSGAMFLSREFGLVCLAWQPDCLPQISIHVLASTEFLVTHHAYEEGRQDDVVHTNNHPACNIRYNQYHKCARLVDLQVLTQKRECNHAQRRRHGDGGDPTQCSGHELVQSDLLKILRAENEGLASRIAEWSSSHRDVHVGILCHKLQTCLQAPQEASRRADDGPDQSVRLSDTLSLRLEILENDARHGADCHQEGALCNGPQVVSANLRR